MIGANVGEFLKLMPILDKIQDLGMAVMADAGLRSGEIEMRCPHCQSEIGSEIEEVPFQRGGLPVTASASARELEGLLAKNKKSLAEVDDGCVEWIGAAIKGYLSASTPEHFREVHDQLAVGLAAVEGLVYKLAVAALGYGGAHAFRVALQYESPDDRVFRRTPKRALFPSEGEQPHTLFSGIESDTPRECYVHIDCEDFSVSIGDRPKCHLGNTIQFRLLYFLWRYRGRYVDHVELANEVDGDINLFPVWKSRLLTDLKNGGFPDLAKYIKKKLRHVGLFLRK